MAGLDLYPVQEDIVAKITTLMPQYQIVEDALPDDATLPRAGMDVKNCIFLTFGGLNPKLRGTSFGGARWDDYYSTIDISVVSAVGRQARSACSYLVANLIGYRPAGGDECAPIGTTSNLVIRDTNGTVTANLASQRFRFGVNTADVGAAPSS